MRTLLLLLAFAGISFSSSYQASAGNSGGCQNDVYSSTTPFSDVVVGCNNSNGVATASVAATDQFLGLTLYDTSNTGSSFYSSVLESGLTAAGLTPGTTVLIAAVDTGVGALGWTANVSYGGGGYAYVQLNIINNPSLVSCYSNVFQLYPSGTYGFSFPCSTGALFKVGSNGQITIDTYEEMGLEVGAVDGVLTGLFSDPLSFTVVDASTGQAVPGVTIEAPDGYEFPVNASTVPEPSSLYLCLVSAAGGC